METPLTGAGSAPTASARHRGETVVRVQSDAIVGRSQALSGHPSPARSLPAPSGRSATRLVVGERQDPVADDLARLVALAGDDQHVARLQHRARPCGWPRPGRRSRARPARRPGSRRGSRPASSERGLSSVTMTTSAFSAAMAPITGRLPRSRSPPQPNTQTSLPGGIGPQRVEHMRQRVGLVGIVDDDHARR